MLITVWDRFRWLARLGAWVGGGMLVVAAITVTIEVILRKIVSPVIGPEFNMTGSDEVASYLFAVGTSLSLAHVVVTRGNVRIDAVYRLLGPRVRAVMDIAALVVLLVFALVLLERAWSVASLSFFGRIVSNTTLRVPMAIPQIAWVVGIALFVFSLAFCLLMSARALLTGDMAGAQAIAGAVTTEEEVAGELQGLGIAREGRPPDNEVDRDKNRTGSR